MYHNKVILISTERNRDKMISWSEGRVDLKNKVCIAKDINAYPETYTKIKAQLHKKKFKFETKEKEHREKERKHQEIIEAFFGYFIETQTKKSKAGYEKSIIFIDIFKLIDKYIKINNYIKKLICISRHINLTVVLVNINKEILSPYIRSNINIVM